MALLHEYDGCGRRSLSLQTAGGRALRVLRGAMFALAVVVASVAYAGRIETCLDGNGWTLDGLPVLVPDCWNKIDGADGRVADGAWKTSRSACSESYARRRGTYRCELPGAKPSRRYFIRCEGAGQTAAVRVNGAEIGRHAGAFTAFCFEATAAMTPGANILEIEVSNEIDPSIPPLDGDFNVCGGLYRSVWLLETDPVCIDPTRLGACGVRVFPSMDGTVRVEADISGASDATLDWEPKKVADPVAWTPETPAVYRVRVTVEKDGFSDTVVQPFGFRTAEIRADGFYLNGVKRKVRGVNRHQEVEGEAWAMTDAQHLRDMRLVKAMGADAVRLCHYPQSGGVLDVCDALGIMVWAEIPVVNRIGGAAFRERARQMLREMIAQQRNHPSVCWWGCWNELYNGVKGADAPAAGDWEAESAALAALAAELDPSRPVVAATCFPRRADLNASIPNACLNIYPGWYKDATMADCISGYFAANPSATTLALSEYGAGASIHQHENPPRRHKPSGPFHPEEWQTRVHVAAYRDILADARVWGSFVWAMFDFAADARREGDRAGINDKGLVTRDRVVPKDAYFFYKANWNAQPMLHLCGRRMRATSASAVDVVAFSNAGDVSLEVNGAPAGAKTPDSVKCAVFENVALAPGENTIAVRAGGMEEVWRLVRTE